MKPTKRDASLLYTVSALAHLEVARDCREQLREQLNELNLQPPARIVHLPVAPDAKQKMLVRCALIEQSIDLAIKCWQKAGRKIHTLRPHLQAARRLANGRVSFY